MRLKLPPILCALIAVCVLIPSAFALDLATFDIIDQGGGIGDMTSLQLSILDQLPGPGPGTTYQIGDYLTLTPADVGRTFYITAATDPDFTLFVQMITNGANDGFGYSVTDIPSGNGVGQAWNEANLFAAGSHPFGPGNFSSIGPLSGPDFAGYDISAVSLTINSFDLTSGGGFNSHDFRATATIIAVPEPATVLPPVLAATALLFWNRDRIRRRLIFMVRR